MGSEGSSAQSLDTSFTYADVGSDITHGGTVPDLCRLQGPGNLRVDLSGKSGLGRSGPGDRFDTPPGSPGSHSFVPGVPLPLYTHGKDPGTRIVYETGPSLIDRGPNRHPDFGRERRTDGRTTTPVSGRTSRVRGRILGRPWVGDGLSPSSLEPGYTHVPIPPGAPHTDCRTSTTPRRAVPVDTY